MCIYGRKHEDDEAFLPWFGGLDSKQLPFLPIQTLIYFKPFLNIH